MLAALTRRVPPLARPPQVLESLGAYEEADGDGYTLQPRVSSAGGAAPAATATAAAASAGAHVGAAAQGGEAKKSAQGEELGAALPAAPRLSVKTARGDELPAAAADGLPAPAPATPASLSPLAAAARARGPRRSSDDGGSGSGGAPSTPTAGAPPPPPRHPATPQRPSRGSSSGGGAASPAAAASAAAAAAASPGRASAGGLPVAGGLVFGSSSSKQRRRALRVTEGDIIDWANAKLAAAAGAGAGGAGHARLRSFRDPSLATGVAVLRVGGIGGGRRGTGMLLGGSSCHHGCVASITHRHLARPHPHPALLKGPVRCRARLRRPCFHIARRRAPRARGQCEVRPLGGPQEAGRHLCPLAGYSRGTWAAGDWGRWLPLPVFGLGWRG
jgi:hypothetical protein